MQYTRGAVAIAAAISLLMVGCSEESGDESLDSALAAAEARAEVLQVELDAAEAENEELSAALAVEADPTAEEATAEEVSEQEASIEEATFEESSEEANICEEFRGEEVTYEEEPDIVVPDTADLAARWGEALEARDSEAFCALYSPHYAQIIERNARVAWNADKAIEQMVNNPLEFTNVELVRVEQFDEDGLFVAEYETTVFWEPGDGDSLTFLVVFSGFDYDGLISEQEIFFRAWLSFVTGSDGHPQRTEENEGDWINVD